jgi:hypothetical protein
MNKETLYAAIKSVAEDLCALSQDEFARELEVHQDGDIAKILLATKALDVGDIEAELFDHYSVPYAEPQHTDLSCLQHDNNLSYGAGHFALQGLIPTLVLSTETAPVSSFATYISGWSSVVPPVRLQWPVQMSFFAQGLPGYEMTKAESYNIGKKMSAESQESIAANKAYSVDDEQEYKLAA